MAPPVPAALGWRRMCIFRHMMFFVIYLSYPCIFPNSTALSFYVTKTVLVGPKWFWSDQIDLDLTIMIWSRPKWNGQVQMWFILVENHNLDLTNSFWSWPFHFGYDQIIMVKCKSIWSDQNHFGPTKTVLVGPKWFWSGRIDLDLTIMIWS